MADVDSSSNNKQELQDQLDALNAQITKQGSHVRQLKKEGSAEDIQVAVGKLTTLKTQASELSQKLKVNEPTFNRKAFDDLVLRKMFVVSSFEIHGGVKGLYDLGPPACSLKVCMLKLITRRPSMTWISHYDHYV